MPITKASSSAVAPAAKGDLVVGNATNDSGVLGVGSNDQVLTADSSTATGLKWATPSSGGMTLISTTTFNNTVTTYTLSSIPQTYKHLLLVGSGLQTANAGTDTTFFRFNGDTGANYADTGIAVTGTNVAFGDTLKNQIFNQNVVNMAETGDTSARFGNFTLNIYDYTTTTYKSIDYVGGSQSNNTRYFATGRALWNNTAAITSITFTSNQTQNLKAGIVRLYGVS